MDMLAIPIPSGSANSRTGIRAVRSTGSLRTPHSSNENDGDGNGAIQRLHQRYPQQQHNNTNDISDTSLSRSIPSQSHPPELSFSTSSLHHDQEAAFIARARLHSTGSSNSRLGHSTIDVAPSPEKRHVVGASTSASALPPTRKDDSWRSSSSGRGALVHNTGGSHGQGRGRSGTTSVLPAAPSAKSRIRLDSVFGTALPGFPYLNSTAAATSTPALSHPVPLHYRPSSSQELRSQSSMSWSNRSRSRSAQGSTSGRSNSNAGASTSRVNNTRYGSGNYSGPEGTADLDTSCSGDSNSSDDVDLDLSWDMDVLRARQQAQATLAAQQERQQRLSQQNQKDKGRATADDSAMMLQGPAHIGIDIRSSLDMSSDSMVIDAEAEAQRDIMRRYRLAGGKRQPKSAMDLRQQQEDTFERAQASTSTMPLRASSAQYGRSSTHHSTSKSDPSYHLAVPQSAILADSSRGNFDYYEDGEMGWSFGKTPPLSPAEVVTFAEQQQGISQQRSLSIISSIFPSSTSSSSGENTLLRKRRPSFPLMSLLDKAMHHSHTPSPAASSPSQQEHESWGSPTPTRAVPSPRLPSHHDHLELVSYPGAFVDSPTQFSSPSEPPALSPEGSNWNSPKTNDDLPTPRSADFDNRYSQFSMQEAAEVLVEQQHQEEHDHDQQHTVVVTQKGEQPKQPRTSLSSQQQHDSNKRHSRRSSSLLRFPFASIRNPFRAAASPQVSENIDEHGRVTDRRAGSPTTSDEQQQQTPSEEESPAESVDSHGNASNSSPPRLGATQHADRIITEDMLRPGPSMGTGRIAGLGISVNEGATVAVRPRQSSLPVLSFSTPSDDSHGHQPAMHFNTTHNDASDEIEVIQELSLPTHSHTTGQRRPASSAPPTMVHFALSDQPSADARQATHTRQPLAAPRRRRAVTHAGHFDVRKRLDQLRPSQLLFIAAFIFGPWCFFVGGWCMRPADGDYRSRRGIRCRCPPEQETCECHAEFYRQLRLSGGKTANAPNGQALIPKMDRFVLANRVGAVLSGTFGLLCAIAALVVVGREW